MLLEDIETVKNKIRESLIRNSPFLPQITHILKRQGKLIRASLLILCANLFKDTDEKIIYSAVVIELIHLASLIHDDVLDESETRRGEKTVNFIWGNRNSILFGDYILSVSLDVLSSKVVDKKNLEIIKILSREMKNMIEGEYEDTERDKNIDEEKYIKIVEKKTGSLFSAACEIGAYLGGANKRERNLLREFGLNCGVAFQITDDILDFTGSEEKIGKPILSDIRRGNLTLPLIYTMKRPYLRAIKSAICKNDLKKIKELVEESGGINYSYKMAFLYLNRAKDIINTLSSSKKNILFDILNFAVKRDR